MKKTTLYILALALCLLLAGCGSAFALTENEPKAMTITAERAAKGAFFMTGALEVDQGERIVIASRVTRGEIRVEILAMSEEQSIDELPDMDGPAIIQGNCTGTEELSGTVPAGYYMVRAECVERATGTVEIRVEPAPEGAAVFPGDYGAIAGDFTGMTKEIAGAYLAVVDELSGALGRDENEAAPGECLHGGFIRDWDGDGTPELCLLLKTSPRDEAGTPLYGWFAPTLYLYAWRDGRAVRAGECDLYFATAGREAAVAALPEGDGLRLVRWDRSAPEAAADVYCYALTDGALTKIDTPRLVQTAAAGAASGEAFSEALDGAQLLLYNISGEARIEGEGNVEQLREALIAEG